MEGLTTVAATPVPFEWKGKQYMLGRFSLGEWAYLEDAYIRHRRQQVIKEAKDLEPVLSATEYQELYREKRAEALEIKEASNEEIQEFIWGPSQREGETDDDYKERVKSYTKTDKFNRGIAFMMSSILNVRYPGEFRYQDVLKLIIDGTITGEHLEDFLSNLQKLQGSEGNQDGEGTDRTEPQPNPQASGQDSAGG